MANTNLEVVSVEFKYIYVQHITRPETLRYKMEKLITDYRFLQRTFFSWWIDTGKNKEDDNHHRLAWDEVCPFCFFEFCTDFEETLNDKLNLRVIWNYVSYIKLFGIYIWYIVFLKILGICQFTRYLINYKHQIVYFEILFCSDVDTDFPGKKNYVVNLATFCEGEIIDWND